MPRLDESRQALLDALLGRDGPSSPSPLGSGESGEPFESVAQAALGLVAEPRVASAALDALRRAGLLDARSLAGAEPLEIDEAFRAAKVRVAAGALRPLRRIARWMADRDFDAEAARDASTEALREDWRALNGIGPATADALLLLGLGRPAYPVDRATYRILVRHGWLDPTADYDEARSLVEGIAPEDAPALAGLSAAFARLGRECCKPSAPRCDRCPLRPLLPDDGPREAGV